MNSAAPAAAAVRPAFKPRRSNAVTGSNRGMVCGSPSIAATRARRGSINRSVRGQAMANTNREDAPVKMLLQSMETFTSGSSRRAALWVKPCNRGSNAPGMTKLAEYPPETPAKAAAMPAKGWRPAA